MRSFKGWAEESCFYGLDNSSPATVEPEYNEPLYNEVFGTANDFLFPSNSKIYEKEPRYSE